jgi:hypothetical protein
MRWNVASDEDGDTRQAGRLFDSPGRQITTPLHCGALGFSGMLLSCKFGLPSVLPCLSLSLLFFFSLSGKQSMDGWMDGACAPHHLCRLIWRPVLQTHQRQKQSSGHATLPFAVPGPLSLSLPNAETARQTPPIRRIRHLLRLTYPLTCYYVFVPSFSLYKTSHTAPGGRRRTSSLSLSFSGTDPSIPSPLLSFGSVLLTING